MRPIVANCDICEEDIYEGDKYYTYNLSVLAGFKSCEECARSMTGEEMLLELGFDYIEAEREYDEWNRSEF